MSKLLVYRRGVSLIELTLAVAIMAIAFFPTMSLFMSDYRITERDKYNIKGANLCKEKLDKALQMGFGAFQAKTYTKDDGLINTSKIASITLDLSDIEDNGVVFSFVFKVEKKDFKFSFYQRKFTTAELDELEADVSEEEFIDSISGGVGFESSPTTVECNDCIQKYTMTVKWTDRRGLKGGTKKEHTYTLQTYQADLRSK